MCSRFDIVLNPQCWEDVWSSATCDANGEPSLHRNIYKPGGEIEGKLQIIIEVPVEFTGIYINVLGRMFVGFNEGDQVVSHNHEKMLAEKSYKRHVEEKQYVVLPRTELFGIAQGERRVLPPGEHQLPFKFDVPTNIPSTFNGSFGFIEYWIDASIDVINGLEIKRREKIIIHGLYDLNLDSTALIPVEESQEGTYCCLCCKNGSFGYTLVLSKRGYSHGDKIRPTIELRNQTVSSALARITFTKMVVYEVGIHWLRAPEEMIVESSVLVSPQTTQQWNTELIIRDQLPVSRLTYCPNIRVVYHFQLKYGPTGLNCDELELNTDITVGHTSQSYVSQAVPVMTAPQTYVYPSVDLTAGKRSTAECQPHDKPSFGKGGNPVNPVFMPTAQPTAPPVTQQPYPPIGPPTGDDDPAPPSYSECIAVTDQVDIQISDTTQGEMVGPDAGSEREDGRNNTDLS